MANNEVPNDDQQSEWSERSLNQLYGFMESFQPTFESRQSNDPILLAQELQKTIDIERDAKFRRLMGTAGEDMLNSVAPSQIAYRHLAIVTSRLIILTEMNGETSVRDYNDTTTMVTGMFDRFEFENAGQPEHAEKDWITMKLVKPEFLFTKSRKVSIGLFDANKNLIPVDLKSELTIPVEAVQGRLYDPEVLFQN